jgi:membrane protein required for colicin V production
MMESLTTIDIVLVGLILFLGLKGLFNGLFRELFGLIGIVGGVFVGTRLGHEAGMYINENFLHLENPSVITVTGFLATLILFWVGMNILGNLLSRLSSASGLGIFDKVFGFAFSALKIAMVLAVVIHALLTIKVLKDSTEEYTKDSATVPIFQEMGAFIVNADFSAVVNKVEEKTGIEGLGDDLKDVGESIGNTINEGLSTAEKKLGEAVESEVSKEVSKKVDEAVNSATGE